MKLRYVFIAVLLFFGSTVFSQILVPKKDYNPEPSMPKYMFSISLVPSGHNSLVSYGIMRMMPDSTYEIIHLSESSFILQFTAAQKSKANPDKINYLEEYEINASAIKNLWKLKYDEYPYGPRPESGWGTKSGVPSKAQFQMLSVYGVKKMADHCYGHNLIKLLLKVDDAIWVGQYQSRK